MSNHQSCLVNKLSHYIDLSGDDRDRLATIEKKEEQHKAQTVIYHGGDRRQHLHVVKEGWLFTSTVMFDGRRQVVRVYHPGDIIGLHDIPFEHATLNLQTCSSVTLCPFSKKDLDIVFRESPRLTALLFSIAVREQVILIDYLRATGRMNPMERLAFYLLDLQAKLKITNRDMTDTFRLPLTQTDVGDHLGLTNVSVSNTMSKMEKQGLLRRRAGNITLLEAGELRALCDFVDRYDDMDVSWFPGSTLPRR